MPDASAELERLRADIVRRYDSLSGRLQQVAAFALEHPRDMGLETITVIAERSSVQPSTVVRFAQAFGYSGASDMQKLFRDELLSFAPSPSYADRVRESAGKSGRAGALSPHELMREFADSNIVALEHLKQSVREADLERAVTLIHDAAAVYLVGLRRSFAVASYLAYALRQVGKKAYLMDGVAGMLAEQGGMLTRPDLLIATTFRPYAPETAEVVGRARENGAKVVAVTDSRLSPIARHADVLFDIKDAEVRQFRSLTASLCLAQTLVIACAYRLESGDSRRRT